MTKQEEALVEMLYAKIGRKQVELETVYKSLHIRIKETEALQNKIKELTKDGNKPNEKGS